MTPYEQGFITKCAEYGADPYESVSRRTLHMGNLISNIRDTKDWIRSHI